MSIFYRTDGKDLIKCFVNTSVSLKQDMFRYIAVFLIVGILLRSFFLYCDVT